MSMWNTAQQPHRIDLNLDINNYFVNVGSHHNCDGSNIIDFYLSNYLDNNVFSFKMLSKLEVLQAINSITSKQVCSDQIDINMIKSVSLTLFRQ